MLDKLSKSKGIVVSIKANYYIVSLINPNFNPDLIPDNYIPIETNTKHQRKFNFDVS